jgi:predicted CXXCH cytochrome family protein
MNIVSGLRDMKMMIRANSFSMCLLILLFVGSAAWCVEKPTELQKTCVTSDCHADYSRKEYVHGPVTLGDCKSCHKPLDPQKHTYEFVRKEKDLCEYCHLEQTTKKNVHEPLKTGNCLQCHDPHSSDNKFLLLKEQVSELCRECHEKQPDKYVHGPVAVGQCSLCHTAHSSDNEYLLIAKSGDLCFSCHVVTKEELAKYDYVHEPAKTKCIGCHSGHGADNHMLLKAKPPELCYPCHEDIKDISEKSEHKHSAVKIDDGCMNCHTPHASTIEFNLKQDPLTLCMSCHDKPMGISKDEVLPPFTPEITDKEFLHGPVAQKDCKGCHVSHGSDHFRLLAKDYPSQFYAPFSKDNYELCFSCHADSLVTTKETGELTDFRNGDINLHYVHVNKPFRGRTCRSCHETHGSNLPKHIRKSVPYGMWELPIEFEKTDTGGSCKPGCHLPYEYDRQSPVEYEKKEE